MKSDFQDNRFTRTFGLKVPIVQGPMGGVSGPELAAAVVNAGALGVIPIWNLPLPTAAQWIERTQELTGGNFGVNLRADMLQRDYIKLSLDAGVAVIHLFWGDPAASMKFMGSSTGAKVMVTVGSADAAKAALDAGASLLVAQGVEAGGHVLSDTPLQELLDEVIPLAADLPVLAAGGLADAQDVADIMKRGASGVLLGTRFVATLESMAHDVYKQALLEAGPGSTVRSTCFDGGWENAPHRNLKNDTTDAWEAAGKPSPGSRPGEDDVILRLGETPIPRYSAMPPMQGMTGEIRSAVMYAGTGVAKVRDCPSAKDVIRELASLLSAG
jgi:NAD(P)H-dependent flavin oxidoreductase YrpB (nitropropane dioxygenase family)